MIAVLLLLLLVVWAAVLIPPWLRGRVDHSPQSSIAGFRRRLSVLATRSRDTRPLPALPPVRHGSIGFRPGVAGNRPLPRVHGYATPGRLRQTEAQRRRTLIVQALLVGLGCTFVLGLLPPLRFFLVFALLDLLALAGYVALLLQMKRNMVERRQKVHPLPSRSFALPSYALERQAR